MCDDVKLIFIHHICMGSFVCGHHLRSFIMSYFCVTTEILSFTWYICSLDYLFPCEMRINAFNFLQYIESEQLKIHGTCPGEFEDVVNQLEKSTGSVVVGQIGRTVILYRPSLTKLKAEEKRKHAQRVNLGRPQVLKLSSQVWLYPFILCAIWFSWTWFWW